MTKAEETRENSFWLDGETSFVLEESNAKRAYELEELESGAVRRQSREPGSQELASPVPQNLRILKV